MVTLTAVPSTGYRFEKWTGDVDGVADTGEVTAIVVITSARTMTANFTPSDLRYTVTANSYPTDGGSVALQPGQPADGYLANQSISVLASAQTGFVFSGWTGDLGGTENPRTVRVSDNKVISALFNPTVTVYCVPSKAGSVDFEPQSSNGYAVGTETVMRARAAKGYSFSSWEGDASGSDGSITVTVDGPKTITARFVEQSPSRWWLWTVLGLIGLFGALLLLRLVYSRMNRGESRLSRPG